MLRDSYITGQTCTPFVAVSYLIYCLHVCSTVTIVSYTISFECSVFTTANTLSYYFVPLLRWASFILLIVLYVTALPADEVV